MLTLAAVAVASANRVTTLRVAAHYNAEQMAPMAACFREYETEHPDIRIVYQQAPYEDFLQNLLISRAGRAPVDIYSLYSVWAPQLVDTGALDAPPPDVDRFVRSTYTPATIAPATINGRLYGVPGAVSVYQLVYNKRLLAAAGFRAPPRSWDELTRMAAAITRKNDQGNIMVEGFAFGITTANIVHPFYTQMYAAGVSPFTADLRHTNLRSPEAVRILEGQTALFRRGITTNTLSAFDFGSGAVGMTIIANWLKDTLQSAMGDRFDQTVGVAPIPTDGAGGTMIYSFFWGVDAASRNRRAAWDLITWMNSPRGPDGLSCAGRLYAHMGDLTGNRGDLQAVRERTAGAFSQGYIAALKAPGAQSQANIRHAEEVDRLLQYYIELAWAGRLTPEAALARADAQITAVLQDRS